MSLKFGDIIDNGYASENNPIKYGIVIYSRSIRNGGIKLTNGQGKFWIIEPHDRVNKVGSIWSEAITALAQVKEEIK